MKDHFYCHECGYKVDHLNEMWLHLKRKTAWSNDSLVGCKVSCFIDNQYWLNGTVLRYNRGQRQHLVQINEIAEKRWLNMLRIEFYIISRENATTQSCKTKPDSARRSEEEMKGPDSFYYEAGLAPIEPWTYSENISMEFACAQSMLHQAYCYRNQEIGHKTTGHACLTERDRTIKANKKVSLLYGELLPRGVNRALSAQKLNASNSKVLYDLGMGTGKLMMQAFLQYSELEYVYGVEISQGRFAVAEIAASRLISLWPNAFEVALHVPGVRLVIRAVADLSEIFPDTLRRSPLRFPSNRAAKFGAFKRGQTSARPRIMEIVCGDMMKTPNISDADIIMIQTEIPDSISNAFITLLLQVKEGARLFTYIDIRKLWQKYTKYKWLLSNCASQNVKESRHKCGDEKTAATFNGSNLPAMFSSSIVSRSSGSSSSSGGVTFPFVQFRNNRCHADRYVTSWSAHRGHHFYLWSRISSLASDHQSALGKPLSLEANWSGENKNEQRVLSKQFKRDGKFRAKELECKMTSLAHTKVEDQTRVRSTYRSFKAFKASFRSVVRQLTSCSNEQHIEKSTKYETEEMMRPIS